jgi:hypothetical protein
MDRIKKQKVPFTQVPNRLINHPDISWKAKGVYSYILSKPDGWDFSAKRICKDASDGYKGTISAIKELEDHGFIYREKHGDGRTTYHVLLAVKPSGPKGDQGTKEPSGPKGKLPKRLLAQKATISNKDNYKVIKREQSNKELATAVAVAGISNEIVSKEWNTYIDAFKPINPLWEDVYKNTTERKALQHLASKIGKEKLLRTIQALPEIVAMKTAPRITKPTELKRDLGKLLVFVKQNMGKSGKYQVSKIH